MKRTKVPASTPTSPDHTTQVPAISNEEAERIPAGADKPAVPLALSFNAQEPDPKQEPKGRTGLKRSEVPAILFEADDVAEVKQAGTSPKFSTGSSSEPPAAAGMLEALPESYGTGRLLLTARDPKCLYAHWDLTPDQQQRYAELSDQKHLTLRVHQENLAGPLVSELPISARAHHSFVGLAVPAAARVRSGLL